MCTNNPVISDKVFDEDIIDKFNSNLEQERIEFSMIEIIENLEKLYFL